MFGLFAAACAFQGPVLAPRSAALASSGAVAMKAEGEIGVTPPLGVWDPLNCLATPVTYPRRDYRRYVELEIKHGRIAMLAALPLQVARHQVLRCPRRRARLVRGGPRARLA